MTEKRLRLSSRGIRLLGKCSACAACVDVPSAVAAFALVALGFFVLVQTRIVDLTSVYASLGMRESTGEAAIVVLLSVALVVLTRRAA